MSDECDKEINVSLNKCEIHTIIDSLRNEEIEYGDNHHDLIVNLMSKL